MNKWLLCRKLHNKHVIHEILPAPSLGDIQASYKRHHLPLDIAPCCITDYGLLVVRIDRGGEFGLYEVLGILLSGNQVTFNLEKSVYSGSVVNITQQREMFSLS